MIGDDEIFHPTSIWDDDDGPPLIRFSPSQLGNNELLWVLYQCLLKEEGLPGFRKEQYLAEMNSRNLMLAYQQLTFVHEMDREWLLSFTEYDSITRQMFESGYLIINGKCQEELDYARCLQGILDGMSWKDIQGANQTSNETTSCFHACCKEIGDNCNCCNVNVACEQHIVWVTRVNCVCLPCYLKSQRGEIKFLNGCNW